MIITISGQPGSGKTTVGRILAKRLGYEFYSMGDLRGKMAMEKGLTIDELNRMGESEDWTDTEVDEYQMELGEKDDDFIVDGRLAYHFIPSSFKVLITVDPMEGARRIMEEERPDELKPGSVEEAAKLVENRYRSDRKRYQKYYGIKDYMDPSNYNLVVDSTSIPAEEVVERILKAIGEGDS